MLVAAASIERLWKAELLSQIREVLARRIADVGPNYTLMNPGEDH